MSHSLWNSPNFPVGKKNGSYRPIYDFTEVNDVMVPTPTHFRSSVIFCSPVDTNTAFSIASFLSWFWQIFLDTKSREITRIAFLNSLGPVKIASHSQGSAQRPTYVSEDDQFPLSGVSLRTSCFAILMTSSSSPETLRVIFSRFTLSSPNCKRQVLRQNFLCQTSSSFASSSFEMSMEQASTQWTQRLKQ